MSVSTGDVALSVVTVGWNSMEDLPVAIRSVAASAIAAGMSFEHILIDNASTDGSPEAVEREFPHMIVIRNEGNDGFSRANNKAALMSRGRFVLFLNPDTEVLGDALPRMVEVMERHPEIGILGPKLLDSNRRWSPDMGYRFPTLRTLINTYFGLSHFAPYPRLFPGMVRSADFQGLEDCDWVCGAAFMVRRDVMARDLWAEDIFFFGEDMEYCLRMLKRGLRVCSTSDAEIIHHSGKSMSRQSTKFLSGKASGVAIVLRETGGWLGRLLGMRIIWLGTWLRIMMHRAIHRTRRTRSPLAKAHRLEQYLQLDRPSSPNDLSGTP